MQLQAMRDWIFEQLCAAMLSRFLWQTEKLWSGLNLGPRFFSMSPLNSIKRL